MTIDPPDGSGTWRVKTLSIRSSTPNFVNSGSSSVYSRTFCCCFGIRTETKSFTSWNVSWSSTQISSISFVK